MSQRPILTLKRKPPAPVVEELKPEPQAIAPPCEQATAAPDIKPPTSWEIIGLLVSAYPQTFFVDAPRKPLVAGIHEQVRDALPHIGKKRLKKALKTYCNGGDYYKSFATETHRVGLDGQPVIEVSTEDKLYAEQRLKELKAFKKSLMKAKAAKKKAVTAENNQIAPLAEPETIVTA
jgi:ProP effector